MHVQWFLPADQQQIEMCIYLTQKTLKIHWITVMQELKQCTTECDLSC